MKPLLHGVDHVGCLLRTAEASQRLAHESYFPDCRRIVDRGLRGFCCGYAGAGWHDQIVAASAFWFPGHGNFGAWQAVTSMFLHADDGHIFFNMFAPVSFGTILEREWGAVRFLIFYFLCGVGAGLIQTEINGYEFGGLHDRLVAARMTPSVISELLTTGSGQMPSDPAVKAGAHRV